MRPAAPCRGRRLPQQPARRGRRLRPDRRPTSSTAPGSCCGAASAAWPASRWAEVVSAGWQRDVVERAREQLSPEVFAYLVQGAREGVSAAEAGLGRRPPCPARAARRDRRRRGRRPARVALRRRLGRCADVPPARGPPRRRRGDGACLCRRRRAAGGLQQHRDRRSRRSARPASAGGCRPTCPPTGRSPPRSSSGPSPAGARRGAHGRHPGGRHQVRRRPVRVGRRRPRARPGQLRSGVRRSARVREGPRPRTARHRVAGPRRPGSLWSSRACCAPTTRAAAVEAGAAAVWVSNHGGRQLDRAIATSSALPAVAAEVGAEVPVYVDGGVRSGLDLLSALGARRRRGLPGALPVLALADGEAGVGRCPGRTCGPRLVEALRLAGCRTRARHARDRRPDWPNRPLTCTNEIVRRVTSRRFDPCRGLT